MITTAEIHELGWAVCERLPNGICLVAGDGGYRAALDGPHVIWLFRQGWAFFRNGRWLVERAWWLGFHCDPACSLPARSYLREATPEEGSRFTAEVLAR